MIVTFTPNPSLDRTVALDGPLVRGEVHRIASVSEQAAGKGVNVATVLANAGQQVISMLSFLDPAYVSIGHRQRPRVDVHGPAAVDRCSARVNTTVTEPDGTTTKLNEPGPALTEEMVAEAADFLVAAASAPGTEWVVLSGSLPPGAPADWYARLVERLRPVGCKVAIDTSDAALDALLDALPAASFDLIKPNSDELAQLTGGDAADFEADAKAGDLAAIVEAARVLQARGITNVMVTLGGSGAVLVTAEGAWYSTAPAVDVKSTVGAGDSSVAGFILADVNGGSPAECLASAVAYGSAAAALPGTTLPTPHDAHPEDARVTKLA